MDENFNIIDLPCEWCGGKVKLGRLPHEDKRIYLSLIVCTECGKVQVWYAGFDKDFPFSEMNKVLDEMTEKYGA